MHPDRFVGLGTVPMQDVDLALEELERVVEMGFPGLEICSSVNGLDLDDPRFVPFFEKVVEHDLLLVVHPNGFAQGERLADHYLINTVGMPMDSTLFVSRMIFGGVLERFPSLKVCVVHGGGYIPFYPARFDHAWDSEGGLPSVHAAPAELVPGPAVLRHDGLRPGDARDADRALGRLSIMAHYVRVLPYRTFRLHPAVCPPYNADFDGDEMNLHVPQSEEARSEAALLMSVQDQLISPRYGGPIIGGIRDFITGAYILTSDESYLSKEEFFNLALLGGYAGTLPGPKGEKDGKKLYTGKQLFSLFLPKDFNFIITSKWNKSIKGEEKML